MAPNEQKTAYVAAEKKSTPFIKLPQFLLNYDLTPTEKLVYAVLLDCKNMSERRCYPSVKWVANRVGRSSSAVSRAISRLVELGLVYRIKKETESGIHLRNEYLVFSNPMPHQQEEGAYTAFDYMFHKIPIGEVIDLLRPREKVVLGALLHCNGSRGCFPKLKTVGQMTNLSKTSVSESVNKLEQMGIVSVERTGRASRYFFNRKSFFNLHQKNSVFASPNSGVHQRKLISLDSKMNIDTLQIIRSGDSGIGSEKTTEQRSQVFNNNANKVQGAFPLTGMTLPIGNLTPSVNQRKYVEPPVVESSTSVAAQEISGSCSLSISVGYQVQDVVVTDKAVDQVISMAVVSEPVVEPSAVVVEERAGVVEIPCVVPPKVDLPKPERGYCCPVEGPLSAEEIEMAHKVFDHFKSQMMLHRGMNVTYKMQLFEIPCVVGIVKDLGLGRVFRLMKYSICEWDVLRVTTGGDGRKLVDVPNFNQIIAYWRPRMWVARMEGTSLTKKKKKKPIPKESGYNGQSNGYNSQPPPISASTRRDLQKLKVKFEEAFKRAGR